jgi:amino acid transporter
MITVLGLIQFVRGKASTSFKESWFEGSTTSPASYSLAFYSGLWAFDGWDQANYVGGEIQHPEKNIPRAIHASMFIVTVRLNFFQSFVTEPCAVTFHYGKRVVLCSTRQGTC